MPPYRVNPKLYKTRVKTSAAFNAVADKIGRIAGKLEAKAVPQGLRLIGEEIMTDIKASSEGHGVPVDTGMLRSTGSVDNVGPAAVELSFGGAAAPYAVEQHERIDYYHRVGEARYLVRGVERWQPGASSAMAAIVDMVREAMRGRSLLG